MAKPIHQVNYVPVNGYDITNAFGLAMQGLNQAGEAAKDWMNTKSEIQTGDALNALAQADDADQVKAILQGAKGNSWVNQALLGEQSTKRKDRFFDENITNQELDEKLKMGEHNRKIAEEQVQIQWANHALNAASTGQSIKESKARMKNNEALNDITLQLKQLELDGARMRQEYLPEELDRLNNQSINKNIESNLKTEQEIMAHDYTRESLELGMEEKRIKNEGNKLKNQQSAIESVKKQREKQEASYAPLDTVRNDLEGREQWELLLKNAESIVATNYNNTAKATNDVRQLTNLYAESNGTNPNEVYPKVIQMMADRKSEITKLHDTARREVVEGVTEFNSEETGRRNAKISSSVIDPILTPWGMALDEANKKYDIKISPKTFAKAFSRMDISSNKDDAIMVFNVFNEMLPTDVTESKDFQTAITAMTKQVRDSDGVWRTAFISRRAAEAFLRDYVEYTGYANIRRK